MKNIKYILLFLIVLLISDVAYNDIKPHEIQINNNTEFDAGYLSFLLAYEIFDIDTLELIIHYLPSDDSGFYGLVSPLPFGEHRYLMLLNEDMDSIQLRETLSHEFIHINQHETGRLESFGNWFIWEGDTIKGNTVPYRDRPFEIEAYNNQDSILNELNKIIP